MANSQSSSSAAAMPKAKPAFRVSPTNPEIQEIQTEPEREKDMPYAPAMRCGDMLFISGATPSPLYHKHPHQLHEHNHPNSIKDQTPRSMQPIKTTLPHHALPWTNAAKLTK